jgi:glycerol-3-phosphate dehydrogenase (NAD+)
LHSSYSKNLKLSKQTSTQVFSCTHLRSYTVSADDLAKMSTLAPYQRKHKVTVIGSGNW